MRSSIGPAIQSLEFSKTTMINLMEGVNLLQDTTLSTTLSMTNYERINW